MAGGHRIGQPNVLAFSCGRKREPKATEETSSATKPPKLYLCVAPRMDKRLRYLPAETLSNHEPEATRFRPELRERGAAPTGISVLSKNSGLGPAISALLLLDSSRSPLRWSSEDPSCEPARRQAVVRKPPANEVNSSVH